MKMESHRHSYRCSCKDLRVYHHECNKVNKPFSVCFEHYPLILHSFVYHMCEILILAHVWDAFGFLRENGCDKSSPSSDGEDDNDIDMLSPSDSDVESWTIEDHCSWTWCLCGCFLVSFELWLFIFVKFLWMNCELMAEFVCLHGWISELWTYYVGCGLWLSTYHIYVIIYMCLCHISCCLTKIARYSGAIAAK
jgi:hypothetical protein